MSTVAVPRSARLSFPQLRDPALLVPLVGAGVLVYLTILPLLMLVVGSFQAEVAPREFVSTLKNYQTAYASQYTYSTFMNSFIFASGSAALGFFFGAVLAWLTERTNTPLREDLCSYRGGSVDPAGRLGSHCVDFPIEPKIRLP